MGKLKFFYCLIKIVSIIHSSFTQKVKKMASSLPPRLLRASTVAAPVASPLSLLSRASQPRFQPVVASVQCLLPLQQRRLQQTDAKASKPKAVVKDSSSFAFNMFKGEFRGDEVFPYPA